MSSKRSSDRIPPTAGVNPTPALPTPSVVAPWCVRLVRPDGVDLEIVYRWMNEPHVAKYWNQAWSRDRWSEHLAAQLAGLDSRPFLVEYTGRPMAYVELYRAASHPVAAHYNVDQHDIGLHIAIGELDLTGRGFGRLICKSLIEAILVQSGACRRIIAEPDVRNNAACRLFQALGMHRVGEVDLTYKRAVLFVFARSPSDVPHLIRRNRR